MLDNSMFGRYKKQLRLFGFTFLPSLVCGLIKGPGLHFFCRKNLPGSERQQLFQYLFTAIEREATKNNLPLCFTNVLGKEVELIAMLERNGCHRTLSYPLNSLEIQWPDFAGYLRHVRCVNGGKKYDKTVIGLEIKRNRKAGVHIEEVEDPAPEEERLFSLLELNCRDHNQVSFSFRSNFLSRLKANLGTNAVILRARKNGETTGVCLILKRGNIWHGSMVGIDHELAGNDFTYFNLAYYRPIADAIAARAQRIFYGNGLNKTKGRRGCIAWRTYVYYKSNHRLKQILLQPWFVLHRNWYEKKHVQSVKLFG